MTESWKELNVIEDQPTVDMLVAFVKTFNDKRTLSHRAVIGKCIQRAANAGFNITHRWEGRAHDGDFPVLVTVSDESGLIGVGGFVIDRRADARRAFMIVADSRRGNGLGQRILQRLIEIAYSNGVHSFRVEVGATNHGSVHIVEKMGFEQYGETTRNEHCVLRFELNYTRYVLRHLPLRFA